MENNSEIYSSNDESNFPSRIRREFHVFTMGNFVGEYVKPVKKKRVRILGRWKKSLDGIWYRGLSPRDC
jgi:hypothetical protein